MTDLRSYSEPCWALMPYSGQGEGAGRERFTWVLRRGQENVYEEMHIRKMTHDASRVLGTNT